MLSSDKELSAQFIFVCIGDIETEALDLARLVEPLQSVPRDTSLLDVSFSLEIEYTSYASFLHLPNIILVKRIRTQEDSSIADLVKVEASEEVCISLVDHAVDDPNSALIFPLDRILFTKFSLVLFRLLNNHGSTWLSLFNDTSFRLITF